ALSDRHALPCWGDRETNPFNPETSRWHLLKRANHSPPGQNMQQKSGFNQPGGIEAVEPRKAGVGMWQVRGQRPQIACVREELRKARDVLRFDRHAPQA